MGLVKKQKAQKKTSGSEIASSFTLVGGYRKSKIPMVSIATSSPIASKIQTGKLGARFRSRPPKTSLISAPRGVKKEKKKKKQTKQKTSVGQEGVRMQLALFMCPDSFPVLFLFAHSIFAWLVLVEGWDFKLHVVVVVAVAQCKDSIFTDISRSDTRLRLDPAPAMPSKP